MHAVKLDDRSPLLNNLGMVHSAKSPHKPSIGVHIGPPHFNEGTNSIVCEVETSSVSVSSSATVAWSKVGDINDAAITSHKKIINDLDEMISELEMQKERLNKDLKRFVDREISLDREAQVRLTQF